MTDQLIDSLLDRLTADQCAEMQAIVETYGQPFEQTVSAIRGASPEVLRALTVTMNLPGLMKGEAPSPEVKDMLPNGFMEAIWRTRHRVQESA